jgi:hypothetical protein
LCTLSLRSGQLQFLGGDRYGFPHLTFQEYLAARYIAAQQDPSFSNKNYDPDKPNYIDLVMAHLHEAWWREVHRLVIGHLGNDATPMLVASRTLGRLGQASPQLVSALLAALADSNAFVRRAAAEGLGQLKIVDEAQLRQVLIALNRRLHDMDYIMGGSAIRRLLDGRPIPGYRWVPIRERRERARKRRIAGFWIIAITIELLLGWIAAGVATYLRVDPFIERFVVYALALVALAAGGVQILSYFRRPPWDR